MLCSKGSPPTTAIVYIGTEIEPKGLAHYLDIVDLGPETGKLLGEKELLKIIRL